jgi:hypothetical protein
MVDMNVEELKLTIESSTVIHAGDQLYTNYGDGNVGRLLQDYGYLSSLPRSWEFMEQRYTFWELADGSVKGEDGGLCVLLSILNA